MIVSFHVALSHARARAQPPNTHRYWAENERSTFVEMCVPPQMKRCLGMVHGSMNDRQCGSGYEGPRCGRCAKRHYANLFGACVSCDSAIASGNGSSSSGEGSGATLEQIGPLLWLALVMALSFLFVFAIVFLIQRRQGGSLMGGAFRAIDFFCYLVILLQTTLYIANDVVKSTTDVRLRTPPQKKQPSHTAPVALGAPPRIRVQMLHPNRTGKCFGPKRVHSLASPLPSLTPTGRSEPV